MSSGTFPTATPQGGATRILTTITYSQPIPPVRDVPVPTGARDDCTYLFLEDRGMPKPNPLGAPPAKSASTDKPEEKKGDGEEKKDEKKDDKEEKKEDKSEDKKEDKEEKKDDKDDALEEDGFEIIEPKAAEPAAAPAAPEPIAVDDPAPPPPPAPEAKRQRPRPKFQVLAVKPATLVMPTLHNLLSPFVLGLSKQARAGASTTGQAAAPTPLSGTSLVITTLAFPPPSHPQPPLTLSVHILPNAASTIFLEAEWEGAAPGGSSRAVLEEFLRGCVPDGVQGDAKFMAWEGEENGLDGWAGVEKTRRITSLLARALRDSNFI